MHIVYERNGHSRWIQRVGKPAQQGDIFYRGHALFKKENGVLDAQCPQILGKAHTELLFKAVRKLFFMIPCGGHSGGDFFCHPRVLQLYPLQIIVRKPIDQTGIFRYAKGEEYLRCFAK